MCIWTFHAYMTRFKSTARVAWRVRRSYRFSHISHFSCSFTINYKRRSCKTKKKNRNVFVGRNAWNCAGQENFTYIRLLLLYHIQSIDFIDCYTLIIETFDSISISWCVGGALAETNAVRRTDESALNCHSHRNWLNEMICTNWRKIGC